MLLQTPNFHPGWLETYGVKALMWYTRVNYKEMLEWISITVKVMLRQ